MLSEPDRLQFEKDRETLTAWWAGDHGKPLVLSLQPGYCVCNVLFPTFWAYLRFALRYGWGYFLSKIPSSRIRIWFYRRMGMTIGRNVYIAPRVFLDPMHPQLIELEDNCLLGGECKLLTHEYGSEYFRIGKVRIGKGAVVGAFSIVRCGVSIGSRVTTGLGSVVYKNVPDNTVVAGNPARFLRKVGETK